MLVADLACKDRESPAARANDATGRTTLAKELQHRLFDARTARQEPAQRRRDLHQDRQGSGAAGELAESEWSVCGPMAVSASHHALANVGVIWL